MLPSDERKAQGQYVFIVFMIMVSKWYLAPRLESDCHGQQKAHGKCSLYQHAHAKACEKYSPTRVSAPQKKSGAPHFKH